MVEYTQLSKGIFSNKVASETKEKTEVIRKDDKKIVLRIFFPKIFQFRLEPVKPDSHQRRIYPSIEIQKNAHLGGYRAGKKNRRNLQVA